MFSFAAETPANENHQPLRGIQIIELWTMTDVLLMSKHISRRDAVFSFLPSQQKRKRDIFSASSAPLMSEANGR
jgi:hypothetical protein